tara:strand:+ start:279 stop:380 length:102 start_codon:yes stop_codon:yes gene_type:complete
MEHEYTTVSWIYEKIIGIIKEDKHLNILCFDII